MGTTWAQLGHILVIVKIHPEGREFPKNPLKNSLQKFKKMMTFGLISQTVIGHKNVNRKIHEIFTDVPC